MDDIKKMLGKKDKKPDNMEKDAKLSALKNLRNEMSQMMQGNLGEKMNKVTVAAKDKEGLKKGLEKAEEILEEKPDMEEMEEAAGEDLDNDMELGEDEEHQDKVVEGMDEEAIDKMMQKLADMKKKLVK